MSQMIMSQDDAPVASAGTASEQSNKQSNIKKDERFDVRWEGMPFKHRKIGRGPKATYEKVCIMPLWLRNLWPTSEFDPCAVWEQAKEEEADEAQKAKASKATGGGKSGGGKGAGGKKGSSAKVGKKEAIQAEQTKKRAEVSHECNRKDNAIGAFVEPKSFWGTSVLQVKNDFYSNGDSRVLITSWRTV